MQNCNAFKPEGIKSEGQINDAVHDENNKG